MIRWDASTRTVSFTVPHWAEVLAGLRRRHWARFLLFIIFLDFLMSSVDQPIAEWVKGNVTGGFLEFWVVFTRAGDSKYWLVPIAFLLPFLIAAWQAVSDRSTRRMIGWGISALVFTFACIALSGLLVDVLKVMFGRARPDLWFSDGFYGFLPFGSSGGGGWLYRSFPSGHAATAFSLAAALGCFFPRARWGIFLFLATPIALSRIAVSVHYLSDIVAGGVIGVWVTYHMRDFFIRHRWVFVHRGGVVQMRAPGRLLFTRVTSMLPRPRIDGDDDDELLDSEAPPVKKKEAD